MCAYMLHDINICPTTRVATDFLYGSTSESIFIEIRLQGLDEIHIPLNLDQLLENSNWNYDLNMEADGWMKGILWQIQIFKCQKDELQISLLALEPQTR